MKLSWTKLVFKLTKAKKIRNRYNQVPNLTGIPHGKVTKTQLNITNKNQEVSPFPAGDHKAAMNRRESMKNTRMIHKRSTVLERSVKYFTGGLKPVLRFNPDVDKDTFGKVTKHKKTQHTRQPRGQLFPRLQ